MVTNLLRAPGTPTWAFECIEIVDGGLTDPIGIDTHLQRVTQHDGRGLRVEDHNHRVGARRLQLQGLRRRIRRVRLQFQILDQGDVSFPWRIS